MPCRPLQTWSLLLLAVMACHPAPPPSPSPTAPPAIAPAPPPPLAARHFDDAPVFVGDTVVGPGLLDWAREGMQVHVVSPDGHRWTQTIESVRRDPHGYIELGYESRREFFPLPWVRAPTNAEVDFEDAALRRTFLASINAPEPQISMTPFRVDYRGALCEDGTDDESRVLMTAVDSLGPDPLKDAEVLGALRRFPRRTLSVDVDGSTLHFAYMADIRMPDDRAMMSLANRQHEAFVVVRQRGGAFEVLFESTSDTHRFMNHTLACQLPVTAPVPFVIRHEPAGLTVYMTGGGGVQRWRVREHALELEATFDVDPHTG